MPYDEGLAERIREVLRDRADIVEKKMFGGIAFLWRGHMLVGIASDNLMARVGPAGYEGALARPQARPMDFTGRPLAGYVFVGPLGFEADADLVRWVEECLQFVATLPPKKVKGS
ncbi:MAG: TfoX/Sxy family protein [Thermoanaerobaculia bacterium]